jgi:molybdenum cofactor biosynthesis protein B
MNHPSDGISSHHQHRADAAGLIVRFSVLTVSDTRNEQTDRSGKRIIELIEQARHLVVHRRIVPDEPELLREAIDAMLNATETDAVITTGGTGVAPRDITIEVVRPLLNIELPGFGELFRMLSFEQIGASAMLSRAIAGLIHGKPLFALPGSTAACELALTRLILPEIAHLIALRGPAT